MSLHALAGWVLPAWVERQLDPASPAFVPTAWPAPRSLPAVQGRRWAAGQTPVRNTTALSHAVVGVAGSSVARVDGRGAIEVASSGWVLDWWVGAEDRWHLPSREAAVRQRSVGTAPVVETAMRVPGGDVVHRAYGAQGPSTQGGHAFVIVEVENTTATPVAVAFVLRPVGLESDGAIHDVAVDEAVVEVDGRAAVVLSRKPPLVVFGDLHADVAVAVLAGEALAPTGQRQEAHCPEGRAQVAVVHPVAHRTSFRVALPLAARAAPTGRKQRVQVSFPAVVPAADQVVAGWDAHARSLAQVDLPDHALNDAFVRSRHALTLLLDGETLAHPALGVGLAALAAAGDHAEVAHHLERLPDWLGADGWSGAAGGPVAVGSLLAAAGRLATLAPGSAGAAALVELVGPVALAAGRLAKDQRTARSRRGSHAAPAEAATPIDLSHPLCAAAWSVAGLRGATAVLRRAGQFGPASAIAHDAARVADRVAAGVPTGPAGGLADAADRLVVLASAVDAGWPEADHPAVAAASASAERLLVRHAVADRRHGTGLSTLATAWLALDRIAGGRGDPFPSVDWLVDVAAAAGTLPRSVHPVTGGGSAGPSPDAWALAELLRTVCSLAAVERGSELALCPAVPERWWGREVDVRGLPTSHGLLSYSIRWHGERPALLWEVAPHHVGADGRAVADGLDGAPLVLTAPGLDPAWSSTERQGEALLAAPRAPATASPAAPSPASPAARSSPDPSQPGTSQSDPSQSDPSPPGRSQSDPSQPDPSPPGPSQADGGEPNGPGPDAPGPSFS